MISDIEDVAVYLYESAMRDMVGENVQRSWDHTSSHLKKVFRKRAERLRPILVQVWDDGFDSHAEGYQPRDNPFKE